MIKVINVRLSLVTVFIVLFALLPVLVIADEPATASTAGIKSHSHNETGSETGSETAIEAGITAVDDKDYVKAFSVFSPLATQGNAEAQYNLAMLYRTGKGTAKNLKESHAWFRRAADQGVSDAQYYLGYLYDNGEGAEQNPEYAVVWYRKAAEQGHGLAQINLGFFYANGIGVQQDIEQAYLWFHVAAAQGYKIAFENKNLIEDAYKKQEDGTVLLEALKKRAREFFLKVVTPFGRPSLVGQPGKMPTH
ncbi:MAG: sel1 repeat family protein [Ectothiorhodospiraceae bacterium]|nr:sel1 repeat family protein [Ectothiorhodospiraceae bacterium]